MKNRIKLSLGNNYGILHLPLILSVEKGDGSP